MSDTAARPSLVSVTLLPSVLRTAVPLIYAMLVRWGVVEFVDPENTFLTNLITIVVTMAFYLAVRLAERYQSQIGWLLGYGNQPVYVKGDVVSVQEHATPPTTTTEVETDDTPPMP